MYMYMYMYMYTRGKLNVVANGNNVNQIGCYVYSTLAVEIRETVREKKGEKEAVCIMHTCS